MILNWILVSLIDYWTLRTIRESSTLLYANNKDTDQRASAHSDQRHSSIIQESNINKLATCTIISIF